MYVDYDYKRFSSEEINTYLTEKWKNDYPSLELLQTNGYIDWLQAGIKLLDKAFQLIEDIEPASVFISYSRSDSSALALLIRSRLKERQIGDAFIDMTIPAGDDWEIRSQEEINKRDYFIALLGEKSLESQTLCKEILWALNARRSIVPIWHNKYSHKKGWETHNVEVLGVDNEASRKIDEVASRINAIRVIEESASGYEKAIIELLSHFGITT